MSEYRQILQSKGFNTRKEYLCSLAEDYGADTDTVFMLAGLLGHGEDFDGLIVELEDYDRNTNNS